MIRPQTIWVTFWLAVCSKMPTPIMTVKMINIRLRPSFSPTNNARIAPPKHPRSYTEVRKPCIAGEGSLKYSKKSRPRMIPPNTPCLCGEGHQRVVLVLVGSPSDMLTRSRTGSSRYQLPLRWLYGEHLPNERSDAQAGSARVGQAAHVVEGHQCCPAELPLWAVARKTSLWLVLLVERVVSIMRHIEGSSPWLVTTKQEE